jgi:hypothetical protein
MPNAYQSMRGFHNNSRGRLKKILGMLSQWLPEDKVQQVGEVIAQDYYEMEQEFQHILEEGFEEAYAMLQEERKKFRSPYS